MAWTVEDLPLLGEVFAVELANSRYRSDREDLDFLADSRGLATWFAHAPAAAGLIVPPQATAGTVAAVREIRDAARQLLTESADGTRTVAGTVAADVLHNAARGAAAHLALDLARDGAPTWNLHFGGSDESVLVAAVASRCILFLGGDDAGRVRRCARPACPMLFVQRHRARRFCHDGCAHSVRQARYYRSTLRDQRTRPGPVLQPGEEL